MLWIIFYLANNVIDSVANFSPSLLLMNKTDFSKCAQVMQLNCRWRSLSPAIIYFFLLVCLFLHEKNTIFFVDNIRSIGLHRPPLWNLKFDLKTLNEMIFKSKCIHVHLRSVFSDIISVTILEICVEFESYFTFKVIYNAMALNCISSKVFSVLK